jgi:hypothetical protein
MLREQIAKIIDSAVTDAIKVCPGVLIVEPYADRILALLVSQTPEELLPTDDNLLLTKAELKKSLGSIYDDPQFIADVFGSSFREMRASAQAQLSKAAPILKAQGRREALKDAKEGIITIKKRCTEAKDALLQLKPSEYQGQVIWSAKLNSLDEVIGFIETLKRGELPEEK